MNVAQKPEAVYVILPAFRKRLWRAEPILATTALFRNNANLEQALNETHARNPDTATLRVVSAAASTGAEADSFLALHNASSHPARVILEGLDVNPTLVRAARAGKHLTTSISIDDGEANTVSSSLIGAGFKVKVDSATDEMARFLVDPKPIRDNHTALFRLGSAATAPIEPADLIMANNLVFHLTPAAAFEVIDNLASNVAPNGVLSIGGSPTGGVMAAPNIFGHYTKYDSWLGQAGERLVSEHGMTALPVERADVVQVTHPTLFARD